MERPEPRLAFAKLSAEEGLQWIAGDAPTKSAQTSRAAQ